MWEKETKAGQLSNQDSGSLTVWTDAGRLGEDHPVVGQLVRARENLTRRGLLRTRTGTCTESAPCSVDRESRLGG